MFPFTPTPMGGLSGLTKFCRKHSPITYNGGKKLAIDDISICDMNYLWYRCNDISSSLEELWISRVFFEREKGHNKSDLFFENICGIISICKNLKLLSITGIKNLENDKLDILWDCMKNNRSITEIFLSDNTKQVLPSLTAVSASSLIDSILSLSDFSISKVQSIIFIFFEKNFLNFLNCELVSIGLSKT